MKFVNLTSHEIVIQDTEGTIIVVEPSGIVARVSQKNIPLTTIQNIPVSEVVYGDIELPEPKLDTMYIVSAIVASFPQCAQRADVVAPDTGPTVIRNEAGHVAAVRGLVRYSK